MHLRFRKRYGMLNHDPTMLIVPCRVDILQDQDHEKLPVQPGQKLKPLLVGRILADEMRVGLTVDAGETPWDVADDDSEGMEAAYASLLGKDGELRADIEGFDPIVYVYRFVLHPDFYAWKRAVMHAFYQTFDTSALILAQHHTTPFSTEEFKDVGFRQLPSTEFQAPIPFGIDRDVKFWLHENLIGRGTYSFCDYIDGDPPPATEDHVRWVRSQGPWNRLA